MAPLQGCGDSVVPIQRDAIERCPQVGGSTPPDSLVPPDSRLERPLSRGTRVAIATCATRDFGHFRAFCTKMQVASATCSMYHEQNQCKKEHLEQMAYAACGHGQNSAKSTWSRWLTPPVAMGKTVQKAPGVDSKRRLWPCERSGGAKGFGPSKPPAPPPSPHLEGRSTCATW